MPRPAKVRLVADHHQFHLRGGKELGDVSDGWTVKATEDRVAVGVGIGTVVDGEVPGSPPASLIWVDSGPRAPQVLKRWSPPPPKPPKAPGKSPKDAKQAAALARSGQVGPAVEALTRPTVIQRAAAMVPERFHPMRDATLLKDVVLPSESIAPASAAQIQSFDTAVADARTGQRFKGKPERFS